MTTGQARAGARRRQDKGRETGRGWDGVGAAEHTRAGCRPPTLSHTNFKPHKCCVTSALHPRPSSPPLSPLATPLLPPPPPLPPPKASHARPPPARPRPSRNPPAFPANTRPSRRLEPPFPHASLSSPRPPLIHTSLTLPLSLPSLRTAASPYHLARVCPTYPHLVTFSLR